VKVQLQLAAEEAADIAAVAERLAREGFAVRWIRTVHVPEHDTCQLVFECERLAEGGRPS
jgi:hypothetical protein